MHLFDADIKGGASILESNTTVPGDTFLDPISTPIGKSPFLPPPLLCDTHLPMRSSGFTDLLRHEISRSKLVFAEKRCPSLDLSVCLHDKNRKRTLGSIAEG
jgi:hypothetical protein